MCLVEGVGKQGVLWEMCKWWINLLKKLQYTLNYTMKLRNLISVKSFKPFKLPALPLQNLSQSNQNCWPAKEITEFTIILENVSCLW